MSNRNLNARQERFCREYIIDFNATQAAIRAGYSAKTAAAQASRLLTNVNIQAFIKDLTDAGDDKLKLTRERVIEEMTRVGLLDVRKAFTEKGDLKHIHNLDDDTAAAVSSIEVVSVVKGNGADAIVDHVHKIKFHDKMRALGDLGKMFGLFEDHQKAGAGEIHIHIDDKDAEA